jgi:hypothetical protein
LRCSTFILFALGFNFFEADENVKFEMARGLGFKGKNE